MIPAFVDTETTDLHPGIGLIYEVGLILPDGEEHHWWLPVSLADASSFALDIGRYHDRHPFGYRSRNDDPMQVTDPAKFAYDFARLMYQLPMAGCVPSFDDRRLGNLLEENDEMWCPWHYQPIDVETLIVGYIAGRRSVDGSTLGAANTLPSWPWSSTDLSIAVGVNPDDFDRHTALGDCRWARVMWLAVMGE